MPSRILKESILDSPTLAKLEDFYQDQFPRFLLMFDDWGCFNADPDVIKGKAYPKRQKVTTKVIEKILRAYYEAGLLFMWIEGDRTWGYWVTWNEHNYCNAQAVDDDGKPTRHKRKTPEPPAELILQYLSKFGADRSGPERTGTKLAIPIPIPIPIPAEKNKRVREEKSSYGDHGNVLLTESERGKLIEKFGESGAVERISGADLYFGSKGNAKDYPSHYLAILNWERMKKSRDGNGSRASPDDGDRLHEINRAIERAEARK